MSDKLQEITQIKNEIEEKLNELIKLINDKKDKIVEYLVDISYEKGKNNLDTFEREKAEGNLNIYWDVIQWSYIYESKLEKAFNEVNKEARRLLTQRIEKYLNDNHYIWSRTELQYWIYQDETKRWRRYREKAGEKLINKLIEQIKSKYLDIAINDIYQHGLSVLKDTKYVEIDSSYVKSRGLRTILGTLYNEGELNDKNKYYYEGVIEELLSKTYPEIIEKVRKMIEQHLNENNYIWNRVDDMYIIAGIR